MDLEITNIIIFVLAAGAVMLLMRLLPSKGKVGEKVMSRKLDKLPKDQYIVLNDVLLPTARGSSQIDHIVVSIFGIFVIETKNYDGWIYGGEHSEYWTQNLYGEKHELYNPILQNAGHVRALRRVLKAYEPLPILPIVAFSGKADLKVDVEDAYVIYWRQIIKVIRQFEEKRLTWDQVNAICKAIQSAQMEPGKESEIKHIQDINRVRQRKENAIASGRRPRCGGKLVLRNGKYGRFYGCSNYPRCKFTQEY